MSLAASINVTRQASKNGSELEALSTQTGGASQPRLCTHTTHSKADYGTTTVHQMRPFFRFNEGRVRQVRPPPDSLRGRIVPVQNTFYNFYIQMFGYSSVI